MTPHYIAAAALAALLALPVAALLAGALAGPAAAQEAEIQLYDKVFLKGNPEGIEGKVVEETRDGIRFRRRNSQVPYIISRPDIERIEYAESPEHHYREKAGKIADADVSGHLELARFCLRFGLERQAEAEAEKAAKADRACVEAYGILSQILRARYGKVDAKVHGEVRDRLRAQGQVVLTYVDAGGADTTAYPANPSGSADAIAGICDPTGRILGLMPHPERHIEFHHHPRWTREEIGPEREGDGLRVFRNAALHLRAS